MNKTRSIELDIIKFWAILLVVIGHVSMFYTSDALCKPINDSSFMESLQRIIYSFHMPLFVFVSGCVYGFQTEALKKKQKFKSFFNKKWKRLMIPYFFIGLLYVAPFMVLWGYRDSYLFYAYDGIFLSHDCRHLWYVWALFNIFILFFVFSKIIEKYRIPKIALLIIAFGCLLIHNKIPYIFQISSGLKYILWFTLGYLLMTYKNILRINQYWMFGFLGGVAFLLQICYPDLIFPGRKTIFALGGITFFYAFSSYMKKIVRWNIVNNIIKNSYGIYLFHPVLIYLMFHYWGQWTISPILLAFIIFIISLIVSLLITICIRHCRLGFIIGENK